MAFFNFLHGAWRGAGFSSDPSPDGSGITFCCPRCPTPKKLLVSDQLASCPECQWHAAGDPWAIVTAAKAVSGDSSQQKHGDWQALLDARKFDLSNPPEKPVPVFLIGDTPIATEGNLVSIQAQAKSGKSSFLGALLAAMMKKGEPFLGVRSSRAEGFGGTVLHFDTEQSRYHHFMLVMRAMARAGIHEAPPWLLSYLLTDLSLKQRLDAFFGELEYRASIGTVACVLLDGVADLLLDPNDPEEAFGLIDRLHQAAIKCKTVIVCVIHENPSGADTGKTRGHLGTQLQRKAETNLRLQKDAAGVITVFTEVSRTCHIPKEKGPYFAWDTDKGMHVEVERPSDSKKGQKTDLLRDEVGDAFVDAEPSGESWGDCERRLMNECGLSKPQASNKVRAMITAKILKKNTAGKWVYIS